jgi:signal transduction histidine kinase
VIVSLCVGGMILLCSFIFLLYDWVVSRASTGQTVALDTKRRFVRFISHEMRTPLNSVRLGMDIFTGELATLAHRIEAVPQAQLLHEVQAALLNWRDLAADVQGNTSAAVDVLNDMLQYDKVRGGSLTTAVH